jgi:NAD-dependent SIR2 family protein deacetylase
VSLPLSERNRVESLAVKYANVGFYDLRNELAFLMRVAEAEPPALDSVISALVDLLNTGNIGPGYEGGLIEWLDAFARTSEHLRAAIAKVISAEHVDFYLADSRVGVQNAAQRLSEALKVERPKHYFDLCRNVLMHNGSIVLIGAGFSYDSYAPLLREMEGIACCVLYDLGIPNHRQLYQTNEREAWNHISKGWERFQHHVASILRPKVPSEQHLILAELFNQGHVTHIVSFNWDDLVEKAYTQLYKRAIPLITRDNATSEHALWKLHGDISNPEERWVLPFEDGRVFQALEQIVSTATCPTFVIGYREQERVVREKLITVLENRGGIIRIRPDAPNIPPDSIADNALMAMKKIKAGIGSATKLTLPA